MTQNLQKLKKIKKDYRKKTKTKQNKTKCPERYQNLSKNEKEKQKYGRECYKNLSKDEKQKLVEYRKKHRMRKNASL